MTVKEIERELEEKPGLLEFMKTVASLSKEDQATVLDAAVSRWMRHS